MWKGSIVALITPYREDGQIDLEAFEKLIEWHIAEGTDGLVLCGTTGEGSLLSVEEKKTLFQHAVKKGKGKIALIGSTGSNQTLESIELTKYAKEVGMDGAIAIVPYYLRPTEEGCIAHFSALAQVGLPLILYDNPIRTGTRLSKNALSTLSLIPGIVALKGCGDLHLSIDLLATTRLSLFSGDDSLAIAQLAVGFTGTISVVGNIVPSLWKEMVDLAMNGEMNAARTQFFALHRLCKVLSLETNPQCIKYALSFRFPFIKSSLRLPLIEPALEHRDMIEKALEELGERQSSTHFLKNLNYISLLKTE